MNTSKDVSHIAKFDGQNYSLWKLDRPVKYRYFQATGLNVRQDDLQQNLFFFVPKRTQLVPKKTQLVPKLRILVPKRKFFNKRGDTYKGRPSVLYGCKKHQNRKCRKSAKTGGHRQLVYKLGKTCNKNGFITKLSCVCLTK
jgi:hypothetical protein